MFNFFLFSRVARLVGMSSGGLPPRWENDDLDKILKLHAEDNNQRYANKSCSVDGT